MTTKVEAAFLAALSALTDRANQGDDVLPVPHRNEVMLAEPDAAGRFLNLVDGDSIPLDETLTGSGAEQEFELVFTVEWSIGQAATGARDADFDAGMAAIAEAFGQIDGGDRTLGNKVDFIRLTRVSRSELAVDNFPSIKAASIEFRITMTAPSLIG